MQVISTNNKTIARNTLFLYLRMFLVLVVSLFTTRVLLHALGVVDYGINNVVCGFVSMFAFLNTSMSNGIQRFYNFSIGRNNEYSVKDVYNTSLQIQFLLTIILVLLLETVGLWYINYKMIIPPERLMAANCIFQTSIISLVVLVLQIPYSAAIMAYERMDYFAYLSIFDVFAKLGIAFAIKYLSSDKLILYGCLNMAISVISFLLYYIYAKKHFTELRLDIKFCRQLFFPMLSFSGWNVLGAFAYMVKGQGLNVLLNLFWGTVVNAARGISNMIMGAIQGFQGNIVIAFRPQLVQSYAEGNYSRVLKLFYSLSKVSFILLSIISIPVILEIDYILYLWLGDTIPNYTVPFTILALLNMIISSLTTPVSQVVHATGKMRNFQIWTSLVVCSILPISWLFLRIGYNPVAVYWVSLLITIFNQLICVLLLKRIFEYSLKEYLIKVIMPCLSFVLVPVFPYALTIFIQPSFFRLMLTVVISVACSLFVSYYLILNKSEKDMALRLIKKRIR